MFVVRTEMLDHLQFINVYFRAHLINERYMSACLVCVLYDACVMQSLLLLLLESMFKYCST